MKLKLTIAGALLALGFATPAMAHGFGFGPAAYPGFRPFAWELLGTRQVDFFAERDTVFAHRRDRYRQVKVCAYRQPVRIYDLDVRFRNGANQDVPVRAVLYPGQCTRAIDLYGHARDIRSVSFVYRSIGGHPYGGRLNRPAVVQLYAR